jgi:hypothetical protein
LLDGLLIVIPARREWKDWREETDDVEREILLEFIKEL